MLIDKGTSGEGRGGRGRQGDEGGGRGHQVRGGAVGGIG